MKKQILVTIDSPEIITNPPQPDTMQIKIDGLINVEVIMILLSAASQIASKELPILIASIKEAQKINPNMGIVGKA